MSFILCHCRNSIVDLSRAELHFLQSIRDNFSPLQCPTVSPQMVLELLTPVSGLNRLHAHARSVHFLGSGQDGSFHILALIQRVNKTSPQYVSYLHWYSLRTPPLQHRFGDKYLSACPDFLSAWLPQHSSLSRYLDAIKKRVKFKQSVLMDCARETLFDFVIQLILCKIYRYAESWMWMLKTRACSMLNRKFPWFLVHSSNFNLVFFPSRNWNRSCVACIQAQALLPILKFCLFVSCLMAVVKLPG